MRVRKPVGRAASYLLTGIVTNSRAVPQPVTRDTPKDDAYYIAQTKAARPAILLYLNGNGPRPKDFWLWHVASQDRKALRRVHAKGLARDDPRYLDALIEALHAGDPLSRKEKRDLAGHMRLMVDLMYPSLEQRASELSSQARAFGRKVTALSRGGTRGALKNAKKRKRQMAEWMTGLDTFYTTLPLESKTFTGYVAEAKRLRSLHDEYTIAQKDLQHGAQGREAQHLKLVIEKYACLKDLPGSHETIRHFLPELLPAKFPHLFA